MPGRGTVNADVSVCDRLFECRYDGQTTQGVTLTVAEQPE